MSPSGSQNVSEFTSAVRILAGGRKRERRREERGRERERKGGREERGEGGREERRCTVHVQKR